MNREIYANELKYIGRTVVTFKWENTLGEFYRGEGPAVFVAEVWAQSPDVRRVFDIRIKENRHEEEAKAYYRAQLISAMQEDCFCEDPLHDDTY